MVFAATVLRGRLATIVVQLTAGIRLFQYQPAPRRRRSTTPDTLRRVEYLERMLLAGRLDGAARARRASWPRRTIPFVGCLCGYVLLRLGLMDELDRGRGARDRDGAAAERRLRAARRVRRRGRGTAAKQSFAEAVGAGVPLFGEGLTRLLEGPRVHDIQHPRAADRPLRVPEPHARLDVVGVHAAQVRAGTLVVTAADTGYEA